MSRQRQNKNTKQFVNLKWKKAMANDDVGTIKIDWMGVFPNKENVQCQMQKQAKNGINKNLSTALQVTRLFFVL
uniref:Uncharacterized protein n=1 Tax=Romanomermis culicivorax TaxID=13658 RepID=A0A915ISK1_ROMCU